MSGTGTPLTRPVVVALSGWLAFLAMVATMPWLSSDSVGNILGLGAVALVAAGWLLWRRSRPALWLSTVLGVLQALEATAYTGASLAGSAGAGQVLADGLGVLAGVLVVAGASTELRRRRQARATGKSSSRSVGGTRQERSSSSPAADSATDASTATRQTTARSRRASISRAGSRTSR